jgi:hypothetical protein
MPVWIQLMVVLQRLGCCGNGNSVGVRARTAGVGNGTVCMFTDRVFKALLSKKDDVIAWPDAAERKQISDRMGEKYGLPGAVGIVDGTPVVFSQRPKIDGEVFWTRKSQYAYNLQLVCDDKKRIRFYQIGWPGSVFDSTVFETSDLLMAPHLFFVDGEYLMADSGYDLSKFVCVPYRQPYAGLPRNFRFNFLFSSARATYNRTCK